VYQEAKFSNLKRGIKKGFQEEEGKKLRKKGKKKMNPTGLGGKGVEASTGHEREGYFEGRVHSKGERGKAHPFSSV